MKKARIFRPNLLLGCIAHCNFLRENNTKPAPSATMVPNKPILGTEPPEPSVSINTVPVFVFPETVPSFAVTVHVTKSPAAKPVDIELVVAVGIATLFIDH